MSLLIRRVRQHPLAVTLCAIFLITLLMHLSIAGFSLPYIDHPDEPASYLKAQEWRGLFDMQGFHDGYPPAFIALHWLVQVITDASGPLDIAPTIGILRVISAVTSAFTAVFIGAAAALLSARARPTEQVLAAVFSAGTWALARVVLPNSVYALPDPYVYLSVAVALYAGLMALARVYVQPRAASVWLIVSTLSGLLAVTFKYSALPVLAAPCIALAGCFVLAPASRRRWVGIGLSMLAAVLLTAFALLVLYGAASINTPGTSDVVRASGLSNILNPALVLANFSIMLSPLNALAVLLAVLCVPLTLARWQLKGRQTSGLISLAMLLVVLVAIPWSAAAYNGINSQGVRFVLPATLIVCMLAGAGLVGLMRLAGKVQVVRITIPLLAVAWLGITMLPDSVRVIANLRLPDARVPLRQWADANLTAGTVLVTDDNHKTFNPIWGGIPYSTWFDHLQTADTAAFSDEAYLADNGIAYLAVTDTERVPRTSDLLLSRFGGEGWRGPVTDLYRIRPLDETFELSFGNQIRLLGWDVINRPAAHGEELVLNLFWEAISQPERNYSLFLHLTRDADAQPLAQADGPPCPGAPQSALWQAGSRCFSRDFRLVLPEELPSGAYRIRLGLYDFETGQRLSSESGEDSAEILELIIDENGAVTLQASPN